MKIVNDPPGLEALTGSPDRHPRRQPLSGMIPFTWATPAGIVFVYMPLPPGAKLQPSDPIVREVVRR